MMTKTFKTISIFFFYVTGICNAQFGINKQKPSTNKQQESLSSSSTQQTDTFTKLTEEDANEIAQIIRQAGEDPQTIQLISKLKDENSSSLDELRQLPQEEILNNLKLTLDELKMMEYLFENVDRALMEMEKEGLIPEQHLKKYKKDPSLLEKDARSSVYFRFISLAVVGGFL